MKTPKYLLAAVVAASLAGCAYDAPVPYASTYPVQGNPDQWHVVSVTPVPVGTGERLAASNGRGSATDYTSTPIAAAPVYVQQPVIVQQPVYYPAPVYYAPSPSYYPPVSIGLDFGFGRSWGGRHGGRNWGGVGIGTRWGR